MQLHVALKWRAGVAESPEGEPLHLNTRCWGVPVPPLPQKQIEAAAAQRAEADALYQELTAELQTERSRMAALEVGGAGGQIAC
jgi:hypothetical protein